MDSKIREIDGITIVDLEEQIKGPDSGKLKKMITDLVDRELHKISLNFENTIFMDSASIGALMNSKLYSDEKGATISVFNLSDDIQDLFEMTNMDKVFEIYSSEATMLSGKS